MRHLFEEFHIAFFKETFLKSVNVTVPEERSATAKLTKHWLHCTREVQIEP